MNEILKCQCNINGFAFIFQDHGWTLLYKELFHLIEQGNVKLANSITLTVTSRYNLINLSSTNSNTSYSNITRQKVLSTISFSVNEHDFPPLSNGCLPILSNVSESRLYQRKPASNVKLVSVHVSPVYASSVGELVKPLNISKPVCSSNVTKRNVYKASSASQLIKPLNVSKSVCSNNATRCNVSKVSSVNKLVKPSTVNKPVLFNNVCNVRNVSSINQLVKTFNVTKSIGSSNGRMLSFVIPLVSLFPILLVIFSQLNLFVNLLM